MRELYSKMDTSDIDISEDSSLSYQHLLLSINTTNENIKKR